jgi:hypothetical protein
MAVPQANDSFLPSDQLWARVGSLSRSQRTSGHQDPSGHVSKPAEISRPVSGGHVSPPRQYSDLDRGCCWQSTTHAGGVYLPLTMFGALGTHRRSLASYLTPSLTSLLILFAHLVGSFLPPDVFLTGHSSSLVDLSLRSLGLG